MKFPRVSLLGDRIPVGKDKVRIAGLFYYNLKEINLWKEALRERMVEVLNEKLPWRRKKLAKEILESWLKS